MNMTERVSIDRTLWHDEGSIAW